MKGNYVYIIFTMFRRKNVYTRTAESRIAFNTSARFNRRRIEVASPEIDFLSIETYVPNYRARAVIIMAAMSHRSICP